MKNFKKFQCIFLSFVLLLVFSYKLSCFNTFAEEVKVGYISGSGVNIRKDATTSAAVVDTASSIYVNVTSSKKDTKNAKNPKTDKVYVWYKISYKASSSTVSGYVREDLIDVQELKLDEDFSKSLEDFPKSYHDDLILLHAIYPEWTFTADEVTTTFEESVSAQDYLFYKLVQSTTNSWRSMRKGCYNWSTKKFVETDSGGWYGASREVIAYYMDPRNFLNPNDIYQYLQQSYDKNSQTADGVQKILDGTFLDGKITDKNDDYYGKTYAQVLVAAAKESNVNPYVLASTIIQEQGTSGSTLSKGSTYKNKKVYNFFNYGATGSNSSEVITNGLKYAYNAEWFTPSAAIIGGAKKYASGYIEEGQDTYFYKNYNVLNPNKLWHQYAQNVADSLNSSKFLKNAYIQNKDIKLNFRIPVYKSLPDKTSSLPAKSDKLNNYYFEDISADGLTPTFERYTFEYSLFVEKSTTIKIKLPNGAKLNNKNTVSLSKGDNSVKLSITSQSGYTNTYLINVEAEKSCKLTLETINTDEDNSSNTSSEDKKIVKGDTNNDQKVTITDLANIRLHLLDIITLKGDALDGADTNGDGKITITDLANLRLHLLEIITLK